MNDKQAIRDALFLYCRGMDRLDRDLLRKVLADDCHSIYHGMFEGPTDEVIEWSIRANEELLARSHQLTNMLIEVDGDSASSEAYGSITVWTQPPDVTEVWYRNRYLDRWEKRNGQWKIVYREHILDMMSVDGVPCLDPDYSISRSDADDPSYKYLPGL